MHHFCCVVTKYYIRFPILKLYIYIVTCFSFRCSFVSLMTALLLIMSCVLYVFFDLNWRWPLVCVHLIFIGIRIGNRIISFPHIKSDFFFIDFSLRIHAVNMLEIFSAYCSLNWWFWLNSNSRYVRFVSYIVTVSAVSSPSRWNCWANSSNIHHGTMHPH